MMRALPDAPLYTSVYSRERTFPEFQQADIRRLPLDHFRPFRSHHRLAAPLLAPAFSSLQIDADVVVCSSSGWAHGIRATGRKIVYCHTPARWLYQGDRYLGSRRRLACAAFGAIRPALRRWDQKAARSAQHYLTQSTAVRDRIRLLYGIEAEVLPAPFTLGLGNSQQPTGIQPGFFLCVSRLLPYKNVDAVLAAFSDLAGYRLVVAGTGPENKRLRTQAPANVRFLGVVPDEQLRWLYDNSIGLIAASYEDYGLTPLEAAAHGKPTAALRWGGYLDTVAEGETGIFFDSPSPEAVREAVRRIATYPFRPAVIRDHASRYTEDVFIRRLRAIVAGDVESERRTLDKVS